MVKVLSGLPSSSAVTDWSTQMRDDQSEVQRCELVSGSKSASLNLLGAVTGKLVGQANWSVCRQCRTATRKSGGDCLAQGGGVVLMQGSERTDHRDTNRPCSQHSIALSHLRQVAPSVSRFTASTQSFNDEGSDEQISGRVLLIPNGLEHMNVERLDQVRKALGQASNAPVSIERSAIPPVLYEPSADGAGDTDVHDLVLIDQEIDSAAVRTVTWFVRDG